jgi:hypothetical protein
MQTRQIIEQISYRTDPTQEGRQFHVRHFFVFEKIDNSTVGNFTFKKLNFHKLSLYPIFCTYIDVYFPSSFFLSKMPATYVGTYVPIEIAWK